MRRYISFAIALASALALVVSPPMAQETFRCTAADGKVTYQQAPCPQASEQRKVDITPANTDFDPQARERLLREGDEAGRRLQAREAEEQAARQKRAEQKARDEERERETQAREESRDGYIYARPPWPGYPYRPGPPNPRPRPAPVIQPRG